jgi:prepilin-type N-terminal cleavage/methylation domain-containing protein
MRKEQGFTMVELMVTIGLAAILFTLSAGAVQNYARVQSLDGAVDEVITQLRLAQQKTISESNPVIYGVRFRDGSGAWDLIRFDPVGTGTADDVCTVEDSIDLSTGVFPRVVRVKNPTFPISETPSTPPELAECRTAPGAQATDAFVFFYARGNATQGSLTLHHPNLGSSRDRTVNVVGITGRVAGS